MKVEFRSKTYRAKTQAGHLLLLPNHPRSKYALQAMPIASLGTLHVGDHGVWCCPAHAGKTRLTFSAKRIEDALEFLAGLDVAEIG